MTSEVLSPNEEYGVLFLQLTMKFDQEHTGESMRRLAERLSPRWSKVAMHGPKSYGIAIVSRESPALFLRDIGDFLRDLNGVADFWIYPAPKADDVVGQLGQFSPLTHNLRLAQVEAVNRNKTKYRRYAQRR